MSDWSKALANLNHLGNLSPSARAEMVESLAVDLGPLVAQLLIARIEHEPLAAEMEAVDRDLLKKHVLLHRGNGERIFDPSRSWLCDDEEVCAAFHADRDAYVAEHYPDLPREFCPALVAEQKVFKAEKALLKAAAPVIPDMEKIFNPKLRKKGLDLLCQIGAEKAQELVNEARALSS